MMTYGTLEKTPAALLEAAAQTRPEAPFLCLPMDGQGGRNVPRDISYSEFSKIVAKQCDYFIRAGYVRGQRVAVTMPSSAGFLVNYFALNRTGVSIVPINPDLAPAEICYQVQHSEASLLICSNRTAGAAQQAAALASVPLAILPEDLSPCTEIPTAASEAAVAVEDECAILYTSGTTGRPKGCVLTNEYFITAGAWYVSRGGLMAVRLGEDRILNPLPLFHMNALAVALTAALLTQGCYVLVERFSVKSWWKDVAQTGATIVHYQGLMVPVLLKQEPNSIERVHRVRFGFGAGLNPNDHRQFEERFGFPLIEGWGMTETGRTLMDNHTPRSIHVRAIGRTVLGFEARVVDDDGNCAAIGDVGELLVRHSEDHPRRGFCAGYLKDPAATEESWRGGWFHTGDLVRREHDGLFVFVDRKKNIIRRSGENISAAEVDATLQVHPLVEKVATIPIPDEVRGEEVFACVVLRPGQDRSLATARTLMKWCTQNIARFKCPGYIMFIDDLPLTPTQKVQRQRQLFFKSGEDPRSADHAFDVRDMKKR